jgi:hypothetical protein
MITSSQLSLSAISRPSSAENLSSSLSIIFKKYTLYKSKLAFTKYPGPRQLLFPHLLALQHFKEAIFSLAQARASG